MPIVNRQYVANYRFGFNGKEKGNEIEGAGNLNTAMFWEYDTRLARRWNLAPKPKVSISSYTCYNDHPIVIAMLTAMTMSVHKLKKGRSAEKKLHKQKNEDKNK